MIIAIEGIDGAGKNTLVTALMQRFGAHRLEVIAFPRYEQSIHAQLAQKALYGDMGDLVDSAYGMATIFALDRLGAKEAIERADQAGKLVLLDRYVASNAAYTAARLEDPAAIEWIEQLEFGTLGLPRPDHQILLATAPALAMERARSREEQDSARTRDRYESDGGLQQRTADAYRRLAQASWVSPWLVLEPDYDLDDVCAIVEKMVAH